MKQPLDTEIPIEARLRKLVYIQMKNFIEDNGREHARNVFNLHSEGLNRFLGRYTEWTLTEVFRIAHLIDVDIFEEWISQ